MKKLSFIIFVILILIISQINLYAAKNSASIQLVGIVLPRVGMDITEATAVRNINPEGHTENLQVFSMNYSSNVRGGYQMMIESQKAVTHQSDSPQVTNQTIDGTFWDYSISLNGNILDFTSGQAMVGSFDQFNSSSTSSIFRIINSGNESTRLTDYYSDTLVVKVISN
ncbi:MAG: hypothetical protein HQ557_10140 [Bacteroidetes bacterium]|nr:hypothetical protein [Bacteroidota bacterium]